MTSHRLLRLRRLLAALLLGSLAVATAHAAEPAFAPAKARLPMADCLDPDRARGWHLIDSDEMLVDAGRQRFHLRLQPSCPELSFNHTIGFRSGDGVGRICGSFGDTIVTPRPMGPGVRCRIAEVTPLTREQYQAYLKDEDEKAGAVEKDAKDSKRK